MSSENHAGDWTPAEAGVLAGSMMRAPSVHNIQPWRLELAPGEARLHERTDLALPHHDPTGRDRIASCGAALANLELSFRALGRATDTTFLPDERQPELVARIEAGRLLAPTREELHRYGAIGRRASHRAPFVDQPVPREVLKEVLGSGAAVGVEARPVGSGHETTVVAKLLHFAAEKFQSDSGYQRELSLWTIRDEAQHRHGVGIAASHLPAGSVPWAGLVRRATELPARPELEHRLGQETLIVFVTAGDNRIDHLRAGYAMERAWLAAVELGLVAAVLTQPLHLAPVRSALCEDLVLSGYPQVLMRIGYSAEPDPPSPRRAVEEVLRRTSD